jgi:hypothetical protein
MKPNMPPQQNTSNAAPAIKTAFQVLPSPDQVRAGRRCGPVAEG